jgi:hypothetical protein
MIREMISNIKALCFKITTTAYITATANEWQQAASGRIKMVILLKLSQEYTQSTV